MELFYRVENEYGEGPYRGNISFSFYEKHNNSLHPSPWLDNFNKKIPKDISHLVFGFSSMKQLKDWFSEEDRLELDRKDFKVNVYVIEEDDEFYISSSQAMADRTYLSLYKFSIILS